MRYLRFYSCLLAAIVASHQASVASPATPPPDLKAIAAAMQQTALEELQRQAAEAKARAADAEAIYEAHRRGEVDTTMAADAEARQATNRSGRTYFIHPSRGSRAKAIRRWRSESQMQKQRAQELRDRIDGGTSPTVPLLAYPPRRPPTSPAKIVVAALANAGPAPEGSHRAHERVARASINVAQPLSRNRLAVFSWLGTATTSGEMGPTRLEILNRTAETQKKRPAITSLWILDGLMSDNITSDSVLDPALWAVDPAKPITDESAIFVFGSTIEMELAGMANDGATETIPLVHVVRYRDLKPYLHGPTPAEHQLPIFNPKPLQ